MRSFKIKYKISALVLSFLVLFGTTGISGESYTCINCGEDYSISLISIQLSSGDLCCGAGNDAESDTGQCNIQTEQCCTYDVETYELSDPVNIRSEIEVTNFLIFACEHFVPDQLTLIDSSIPAYKNYFNYCGRDLVILNSQYRT